MSGPAHDGPRSGLLPQRSGSWRTENGEAKKKAVLVTGFAPRSTALVAPAESMRIEETPWGRYEADYGARARRRTAGQVLDVCAAASKDRKNSFPLCPTGASPLWEPRQAANVTTESAAQDSQQGLRRDGGRVQLDYKGTGNPPQRPRCRQWRPSRAGAGSSPRRGEDWTDD